jgi:uncharacterized protein (TIGR02246 family)
MSETQKPMRTWRAVAWGVALGIVMVVVSYFWLQHAMKSGVRAAPSVHAAQQAVTISPQQAILQLLMAQTAAWNRGDLDAFASGYEDSPATLFIGSQVHHGYAQMLAGYKQHYPTRAAMGTLTFSQLEVQPLHDAAVASATGHYHLQRAATAGGNADGYFLLVLEQTPAGWKIVRDDTTALPAVK